MAKTLTKPTSKGASTVPISPEELNKLLAEIERLKLENAVLRQAAGIKIHRDSDDAQVEVSADEKNALLK